MIIPPHILKLLEKESARCFRADMTDEETGAALDTMQNELMAREAARDARRQDAIKMAEAIAARRAAKTAFLERIVANAPAPPIGIKITLARQAVGISQATLATAIGVTVGALCHWETGRAPIPDERLEQIAAAFDKPVSYFKGENQ